MMTQVFRQSELTPEELGVFEIRLRSHGFQESLGNHEDALQPREYYKKSSTGAMDDFFNGTWWSIFWRPQ